MNFINEMNEKMKTELVSVEEAIRNMEDNDTAWLPYYKTLCKKRRALKKVIREFDKLEAKANGKN